MEINNGQILRELLNKAVEIQIHYKNVSESMEEVTLTRLLLLDQT